MPANPPPLPAFRLPDLVGEAVLGLARTAPVLDRRSRERLGRRPAVAPAFLLHIPRLALDLRVELQRGQGRRLLLGSRRSEDALESRFEVEILSTREPPGPLTSGAGTFSLDLPDFLELDRARILRAVTDLRLFVAGRRPDWRGRAALESRLETAERGLEDGAEPRPWEGAMLFHTRPRTRLLCLVGDRAKRDGVFELHDAAAGSGRLSGVAPVTYPGDGAEAYPLQPLVRLLFLLRDWAGGRIENRRRPFTPSSGVDFERLQPDLADLLGQMAEAYRTARELAAAPGYRVETVRGEVRAVMTRTRGLVFRRRRDQLVNTLNLELEEAGGELRGTVRWSLPEIVVAGSERDKVLGALLEQPRPRARLRVLGALPRRGQAAVFLASGTRVGARDYLVLWPLDGPGEREILLYADLEERHDRLDQYRELGVVSRSATPEDGIRADYYKAFHRFFVDVDAWLGRWA